MKDLRKAQVVESVSHESKNGPLKVMKEAYPEYFDEESVNNNREGIKDLGNYLLSEYTAEKKSRGTKKKYVDIKEALEAKKALEENTNMIIPFIPFATYSPIIFSISFTIFSFFIYFNLIDINPINFDILESYTYGFMNSLFNEYFTIKALFLYLRLVKQKANRIFGKKHGKIKCYRIKGIKGYYYLTDFYTLVIGYANHNFYC